MRRMYSFVLVVMLVAISGCSSLKPTDGDEGLSGNPPGSSSMSPANPATSKPEQDPVKTVEQPWQSGQFQKGIQLYWHSESVYTDVDATRILDYVVDLGANSVGLTFPIYVDGYTPTRVYAGKDTPSVADLHTVIKEAQARKLRVQMRPLIAEGNIVEENPIGWRGSIEPENLSEWYKSYERFLRPYLQLAEQQHVEEFVLGSELTNRQTDSQWIPLRKRAKAQFSGQISYTVNWEWLTKPRFRNIGIDLYPSLQLGDDATVNQLTNGIYDWLSQQRRMLGPDLTIQEVGIPALSGAYVRPWSWGTVSGGLKLSIQSHWFTAAYRASRRAGVEGIYYWSVDSTQQLGKDLDVAAQPAGNFIGRPGESAIRRAFK